MSYIIPSTTSTLPGGVTLVEFIQSVLVGISGLPGTLVRPAWQINPPKQPDVTIDWLAYRLVVNSPYTYSDVYMDEHEDFQSSRQQELRIACSFYGPHGLNYAQIVQDGFQIPPNLVALTLANMGFVNTDDAMHVPDLVNERWVDRFDMNVFLRRQVQRTYAVPSLVSASGSIHTQLENQEYILNWQTPEAQ